MTVKFIIPFMICFVSLLGYIGGTIYIAALPELSQTFQVPASYIKFTITIYYVGIMIGTFVSGPFSEMISRKRALPFFLFLSFSASILCGLSYTIHWFLIGRLFEGIGHAGGPVLVMALVADHFKGDVYKKLMSFILIMISLGPGLSPIYGSLILHFFDWNLVFFIMAFFEFLAFGLVLMISVEEIPKQSKLSDTLKEYVFFIKHPTFRYHCLLVGILSGAFSAFMMISPYIFRLEYGWGILDFAWIGLALGIANSLGSYLDKELVDRILGKNILLIGLSLIGGVILSLFLMGLPANGLWIMYTITLFVIGENLISSFLTTSAMKLGVSYANVASSLISLSKGVLISLTLFLIPFLPETITVVNLVFFCSFLICTFGYFKIYKIL